jgi:hypothetical protein
MAHIGNLTKKKIIDLIKSNMNFAMKYIKDYEIALQQDKDLQNALNIDNLKMSKDDVLQLFTIIKDKNCKLEYTNGIVKKEV